MNLNPLVIFKRPRGRYLVTAAILSTFTTIGIGHGSRVMSAIVSGRTGDLIVSFFAIPVAAPANDNFANAQLISGSSGNVSGTTVGATKESGEPEHAGNVGGSSVWYRWQAPSTGAATFTTTGSTFNTLLGVYSGSNVILLATVGNNDDDPNGGVQSRVTFVAASGATYYIGVDGFNGATGSVKLNWTLTSTQTVKISGSVKNVNLSGLAGMTVSCRSGSSCGGTLTDSSGNYTLVVTPGDYMLHASCLYDKTKKQCTNTNIGTSSVAFTPSDNSVNAQSNITAQAFIAQTPTFTISGRVKNANNTATFSGVIIDVTGTNLSKVQVKTANDGTYTVSGLNYFGNYLLTPEAFLSGGTSYSSFTCNITAACSNLGSASFPKIDNDYLNALDFTASPAAPTSVSSVSGSGVFNGIATLTATLTSNGSGLSGKTVNFTVNSTAAGSAPTNPDGVAMLSGVGLSGVNAGSYPNAVGASFVGDASFSGGSATGTLTVIKVNQTITVNTNAPSSATYKSQFTVAANSNSGLPVTYSSSGACTNSGATLTMTSGTGTCTVKYDQAGNNNYNAATQLIESVAAQKANQTITFGALTNRTYGDADFAVSATATSALGVSFAASGLCTVSSNTVHLTGVGLCTITASQSGDNNYKGAVPVSQSFNIIAAIPRTNVALKSNGGVASASSEASGYPASAVNDGDRKGLNWGNGGGWNDATPNTYPDWVEVDFNGAKTINEIDVFTLQDSFSNPAEPTDTMTFISFGVTAFDVQYWDGSSWVTAPGGSVTDNKNVWRKFTFSDIQTTKIRVLVNDAKVYSRIVEVEAWSGQSSTPPPSVATNVALKSNGGVASASSEASGYPASAVIDSDRKGLNWGNGGGWNDATPNTYPDWVEVDFNGAQTINEIDVFTLQDNFSNPIDPSDTMTFSSFGITNFEVQCWDVSKNDWVKVGSVSENDNHLVKRTIKFAPVTATKIKVVVNNALAGYSRITEIEAYNDPSVSLGPINYALGGTASASSEVLPGYPARAVTDGDRKGLNWGNGGGWNDNTRYDFTNDWVQIDFENNGVPTNHTINEIDVFTVQDTFWNPINPTDGLTFNLYGITNFEVQCWDVSKNDWVKVGSVSETDPHLVKRTFPFSTGVTTSKIRVVVKNSPDGFSRIVEVEAWGPP